jgi:hypothetical protein
MSNIDIGSNLGEGEEVRMEPFAVKAAVKTDDNQPASAPRVGKRVRIILEENDQIPPTGQFLSINGKAYILRPGEEADVPEELLSVLNDAVEDAAIIGPDTRVLGYRKKMRFPYRVVTRVE